jgi:hypothetical protein
MKGVLEQNCVKDKFGIWRYPRPVEGMDKLTVLTVCVTEKHWRGVD